MSITANLVVQFSQGVEDGLLKAEIDNRKDGFNQGRTSFSAGDDVYYLTYLGAKTNLLSQLTTLGTIAKVEVRTRTIEEVVSYVNSREASASYPITGNLTYAWQGLAPGILARQGDQGLVLAASGVGRAKISYLTTFTAWRLTNLPALVNSSAEYGVLVVITGGLV